MQIIMNLIALFQQDKELIEMNKELDKLLELNPSKLKATKDGVKVEYYGPDRLKIKRLIRCIDARECKITKDYNENK
jgi:hypothetical protein